MEKVYGYVRISEEDNDKGTSLENQKELLQNTCAKKEWNLIQTYEDRNLSGSDRFRKGFTDMIRMALKDSEIKIIVIKDQSRFARDSAFFMDTLKDLNANRIKVFSIIKNDFIYPDDLGDIFKSVADDYKVIEGRKYAKISYEQKKEKGLPPFRAPFGYSNKKKKWAINFKKEKIILSVCQNYVNGINLKDTCHELEITKPLYYRIIRNTIKEIYSGFVYYENKIKDSNGKVVRVDIVKYKGQHKIIIFEELFKKVKDKHEVQTDKENFRAIKKYEIE